MMVASFIFLFQHEVLKPLFYEITWYNIEKGVD